MNIYRVYNVHCTWTVAMGAKRSEKGTTLDQANSKFQIMMSEVWWSGSPTHMSSGLGNLTR